MIKSQTIDVDGVGPVLFEQSRRARRILIYVKQPGVVRVAVPVRASFKNALEFVHLKKEWVQKHLAEIEHRENRNAAFRDALPAIDKADARRRLADKLSRVARRHGFTYTKVYFRQQKTRWGSCSRKNNISLNLALVLLPQQLIDYVMLHELVHTRIHNHSKKFWAELDRYVKNSKGKAKRLKMNDLRLP